MDEKKLTNMAMDDFPRDPEAMDTMDESDPVLVVTRGGLVRVTPDTAVSHWQQLMSEGVFSASHLRDYWRITVPRVYKPELNRSCLEWAFDEDQAVELLLKPLEKFICNDEPRKVLENLAKLDRPPSVCGRVFKMGEPAYSCRECGMDNTCVLCVECFKVSVHRNHKYKMGTSCGGGCCDCGDVEAWKSDPYCDLHMLGTLPVPAPQGLPADIVARTKEVFSAVLGYCYQLLTLDHSPGLPSDLRLKDNEQDPLRILEQPDSYCTVLYNDETHTFEQVIQSLTRVIKCAQRDAIEYVTNIDREGRAVVKCSTFQVCNELKTEIEKFTSRQNNRSLKVLVVHTHVVAHQIFAMKLLQWLQSFMSHAEGFRRILSEVALAPRHPELPVAEGILLRDCQLWKSARTAWHKLLILGMLMDLDTKKALSKVFTKNYGAVMKDFIQDDHDHAFSVSSLSVQIFTTPTLAHHLIAHEDALFILLNTFLSECNRKVNKNGKLEFERTASTMTFKRAQFILYDLKYLLSVKPDVWTDELRKGFLQGLSLILSLLSMMQGMDTVSRQVGQHIEYEPEWETAFNLHIKLATVVSLALEWCGSDKVVLVKAYRATLMKLNENPPLPNAAQPGKPTVVHELTDHSATCIAYDVSALPVSIHLPLSRFLAGLHLHLHKYGLSFDSLEFQIPGPVPEQIIEPVLRTQAMIAQVHAGMWRRNGYALLNQLYFYHNVKCRSEMLDRDIVLLQVGASLIESNEFLIHLLNKFNLINWAASNFEAASLKSPEEDSMRQTISLVEEFLGLCITIIGERHVPGVGDVSQDERTMKEIIQQLCVKPLSHSELNKTLPEDQVHETGMENVIDQVAIFKKPSTGQGKGVYTLKKEFYSEYNVFFYHYTREELSRSEEIQRKRRKTDGELECCPPPELVKLAPGFTMLTDLLQCDVMLHIMNTVLTRSLDLRARSFSELQLHKILHLMGMALNEQVSGRYPFLVFTKKAVEHNLDKLLEELVSSARIEAHRDLITWTLNKFRSVASMDKDVPESSGESTKDSPPPPPSNIQSDSSSTQQDMDKEWRAKMAAQKRASIMAQMQAMQKNFMMENASMFEPEQSSSKKSGDSDVTMDTTCTVVPEADDDEGMEAEPVALQRRKVVKNIQERTHTCILCQEDTTVSLAEHPLVLAGFVQLSTVHMQNRVNIGPNVMSDNPFLESTLAPAMHVSTCGHVMHGVCWRKHFDHVIHRESRRPYRLRQPASYNIEKQEFLCPLCECLSNSVLPLLPSLVSMQASPYPEVEMSFSDWLAALQVVLKYKIQETPVQMCEETCREIHCHVRPEATYSSPPPSQIISYYSCSVSQIIQNLGPVGENFAALFPSSAPVFDKHLKDLIMFFSMAMYTRGCGVSQQGEEAKDSSMLKIAWAGAAYTLHSVERLHCAANKPLLGHLTSRHRDSLQAFVRISGAMGGTITKQEIVSSLALQLLSCLVGALPEEPCLLQWDSLGILVALTMSVPGLFANHTNNSSIPIDPLQALHILKLTFLAHITKVMLTSDLEQCSVQMEGEDESGAQINIPIAAGCNRLLTTLKNVRRHVDESQLTEASVWRTVQDACQSFLRCCCLFYHFLMDVPAPQVLTELGGDTYENMCRYLNLPTTFDELFDSPACMELVTKWSSHPEVILYLNGNCKLSIVKEPRPPNTLVQLPNDYSELINAVSLFICPNSDREDSRNPTMCLVCGDMLCSQSYCCQTELNKTLVGACTYHSHVCGAGVGIFLRVRECEVLLLASTSKGCVVSPPYVDEYGETDQGLRRGNPLRLCTDAYNKLQMLWLSHGIHEEIARNNESSNSLMTTTWQHL